MNTFFSSKCITLLIKGTISLIILSALIIEFIATPLVTHAQVSRAQQSTNQAFSSFCSHYYNNSNYGNKAQDTYVCQQFSNDFSLLLQQDSPNGSSMWPNRASLNTLAQKSLLLDNQTLTLVETPQAFVNTIRTNPDLQALVSGSGNINENIPYDPAFLSALWDYTYSNSIIDRPVSAKCTNISPSYYYSKTWGFVGPSLLEAISQELMNNTDIQQIYSQLTTNGHCSVAALAINMHKATDGNSTYQLEKYILGTVQSQFRGSPIHDVSAGLRWIMSQNNKLLVDDWISFAISINPNKLVTNNKSTSGSSHVSVG